MKLFTLATLALLPAIQAVAQSNWNITAYSNDDCSATSGIYATVVGSGPSPCVTWSGASWWMTSYGGQYLNIYTDTECQDQMVTFYPADTLDICYDNAIDSVIGPYGSFSFSSSAP